MNISPVSFNSFKGCQCCCDREPSVIDDSGYTSEQVHAEMKKMFPNLNINPNARDGAYLYSKYDYPDDAAPRGVTYREIRTMAIEKLRAAAQREREQREMDRRLNYKEADQRNLPDDIKYWNY